MEEGVIVMTALRESEHDETTSINLPVKFFPKAIALSSR